MRDVFHHSIMFLLSFTVSSNPCIHGFLEFNVSPSKLKTYSNNHSCRLHNQISHHELSHSFQGLNHLQLITPACALNYTYLNYITARSHAPIAYCFLAPFIVIYVYALAILLTEQQAWLNLNYALSTLANMAVIVTMNILILIWWFTHVFIAIQS